MATVATDGVPVKSMKDVRTILKRGIGLRRAMHQLAEWDQNRRGQMFTAFRVLPKGEQAAYEQITERMIAAFEAEAFDHPAESREELRVVDRDAALMMERTRARLLARDRGHELGAWTPLEGRFDEAATCRRCSRPVVLVVAYDPLLEIRREGSALAEGCLVVAESDVVSW